MSDAARDRVNPLRSLYALAKHLDARNESICRTLDHLTEEPPHLAWPSGQSSPRLLVMFSSTICADWFVLQAGNQLRQRLVAKQFAQTIMFLEHRVIFP